MKGPAGNVYPKYSTGNPVARRLIDGFIRSGRRLLRECPGRSVLDVGCGRGELWSALRPSRPEMEITLVDLHRSEVALARRELEPRLAVTGSGERLPFRDASFDLVTSFETLEHLADPAAGLRELARVSRGTILVSVPREPLWRLLNLARGAYWTTLGNTPGHWNHWSSRGFVRFLEVQVEPLRIVRPLPWTMVLARVR